MFNFPIESKIVKFNVHKKDAHLPSLMSFIAKESSLNDLKSHTFFVKRSSVIRKISDGRAMFNSDDSEVDALEAHARKHWILSPSTTQLVESKVKGTSFCKST